MRVLIRVDASPVIGSGHLVRCRSLARALQAHGAEVRFCGRFPAGTWQQALIGEGAVLPLQEFEAAAVNPREAVWLPCSEAEDAAATLQVLNERNSWSPDWIVVDHYGLSAAWQQQMRVGLTNVRIVVVDDLADRPHDPDLLVDHNFFGAVTASRYDDLLPKQRDLSLCLGPQFALLDPLYASFQGCLLPRRRLRRLLISLGGAGDAVLLLKILQVLVAFPNRRFDVQLVMGCFAQGLAEIQALCDQLQVEQIRMLPSLAPLMAAADVSIGAGGTTTWERLCMGLPSITYSLAANQEGYSQQLADQGLIRYLGPAERFDAQELQTVLQEWQKDPASFQQQSCQGMALVDGFGCVRVARLMASAMDTAQLPQPFNLQDWQWPDGLALQPLLPATPCAGDWQSCPPGPLRLLDRIEMQRRQDEPSTLYWGRQQGDSAANALRVTVLSSPDAWMNQFIPALLQNALDLGCGLRWIHYHEHLRPGDVCFLLSYGRIVSRPLLDLHRHNLVVHASALPQGKGWSPMTWQILDGAHKIPLTLFEAVAGLDAGPIHAQQQLVLQGHELAPEWQQLQARATVQLCSDWLEAYPNSAAWGQPQQGEETVYPRRRPQDSRLDPECRLRDLFPLLRVVDNQVYPAFFDLDGHCYRLTIEPCDPAPPLR